MSQFWVGLAGAFLWAWVTKVGRFAWEELCELLYKAVAEIEETIAKESGAVKREAVLTAVFNYIDSKTQLQGFERWLVRQALVLSIQGIVVALNDTLGHDWLAAVKKWHEDVEGKVPWLKAPAL